MVAIFTGLGAGFERGSGSLLGAAGLLGSSSLGRGGEGVFLNAANGNLLLSHQDEFLVGRGPDISISRTYNSLGALDENGDHWRQSTDLRVFDLQGDADMLGDNIIAALPDVIGSTIGEMIAGAVAEHSIIDRKKPIPPEAIENAVDGRLDRIQWKDSSGERLEISDEDYEELEQMVERAERDRIVAAVIKDVAANNDVVKNTRNIQTLFTALGWDDQADLAGVAAALQEGAITGVNEVGADTVTGTVDLGVALWRDPIGTLDAMGDALDEARLAGRDYLKGMILGRENLLQDAQHAVDREIDSLRSLTASDPEAAAREIGRRAAQTATEVGMVFIPASRAGRVGGLLRKSVSGGGSLLRSNPALRGEVARILGTNGAYKFTEAKGVLYAANEARRLGYEFKASLVYNTQGHGIDAVFYNANKRAYAVWEAKGSYFARGPGDLARDTRGMVTLSDDFIDTRLARALNAVPNGANAGLIKTLQAERLAGRLERFATFTGSRSTYSILPGTTRTEIYPNGKL